MKHEYKSNRDQFGNLQSDYLMDKDALKTKKILTQARTEYTHGATKIIEKVQSEFLAAKRYEEIDKALEQKDKARFMALTSEGWEQAL
ncbi:IDEAL domain-containing protein [Peribacillus sp. SCS-37]|uniref:IDEAL domain-containing protein n=1 Tax=Paraperibacillus esterisolvens TaxID=3115296 RepID=UPI003905DEFE